MQVNSELALLDNARSPTLPPQPMVDPSGDEDCQIDCWSLCENSLGGSGKLVRSEPEYCALVSGATSGPTFICTAAWPALKRPAKPVMAGFSAYCRPLANAVVGASSVGTKAVRASAIPPAVWPAPPERMVLYKL